MPRGEIKGAIADERRDLADSRRPQGKNMRRWLGFRRGSVRYNAIVRGPIAA